MIHPKSIHFLFVILFGLSLTGCTLVTKGLPIYAFDLRFGPSVPDTFSDDLTGVVVKILGKSSLEPRAHPIEQNELRFRGKGMTVIYLPLQGKIHVDTGTMGTPRHPTARKLREELEHLLKAHGIPYEFHPVEVYEDVLT